MCMCVHALAHGLGEQPFSHFFLFASYTTPQHWPSFLTDPWQQTSEVMFSQTDKPRQYLFTYRQQYCDSQSIHRETNLVKSNEASHGMSTSSCLSDNSSCCTGGCSFSSARRPQHRTTSIHRFYWWWWLIQVIGDANNIRLNLITDCRVSLQLTIFMHENHLYIQPLRQYLLNSWWQWQMLFFTIKRKANKKFPLWQRFAKHISVFAWLDIWSPSELAFTNFKSNE